MGDLDNEGAFATVEEIVALTLPKRSSGPLEEHIYVGIVKNQPETHYIIRDAIDSNEGYGSYFDDEMRYCHMRLVNARARYRVDEVHKALIFDDIDHPMDVAECTLEWCELDLVTLSQ